MWTQEIINVVVENKNENEIYESSLWLHNELNILIKFLTCYKWGAIELTSAQFEAIEETSVDAVTYDTQYNTGSRFEIQDFEEKIFFDGKNDTEVAFCGASDALEGSFVPDDSIYSSMSDFSWFKNKYGVDKENMSELFLALSENGWKFVGHTYSIEGDVSVMRKSEYDYLWTNNVTTDEVGEETNRYRTRIEYLNNKIGT